MRLKKKISLIGLISILKKKMIWRFLFYKVLE